MANRRNRASATLGDGPRERVVSDRSIIMSPVSLVQEQQPDGRLERKGDAEGFP
jgi:hypothetical protein